MKDGIEGEGGCDEDHGHDDDHEGQGGQSYKTSYLRHLCSNLFDCEKEQHALKNVNQMFEYQHFHLLRDIWWSKFKSIFNNFYSIFSVPLVIRRLYQLMIVVTPQHWCLICAVPLEYLPYSITRKYYTTLIGPPSLHLEFSTVRCPMQ